MALQNKMKRTKPCNMEFELKKNLCCEEHQAFICSYVLQCTYLLPAAGVGVGELAFWEKCSASSSNLGYGRLNCRGGGGGGGHSALVYTTIFTLDAIMVFPLWLG